MSCPLASARAERNWCRSMRVRRWGGGWWVDYPSEILPQCGKRILARPQPVLTQRFIKRIRRNHAPVSPSTRLNIQSETLILECAPWAYRCVKSWTGQYANCARVGFQLKINSTSGEQGPASGRPVYYFYIGCSGCGVQSDEGCLKEYCAHKEGTCKNA